MVYVKVDASRKCMPEQLVYYTALLARGGWGSYSLICTCQLYKARSTMANLALYLEVTNEFERHVLDFGAMRRVAFIALFVSRSIIGFCGAVPNLWASSRVYKTRARRVSDFPIPMSSASIPPLHFEVILACLIFVILCLNLSSSSACKFAIAASNNTHNTRRPWYSGSHMEHSSLLELPSSRVSMNCKAASWWLPSNLSEMCPYIWVTNYL